MNATQTAQVASYLNVPANSIREIQVWASVLFVKFNSGSPRFVSKKALSTMTTAEEDYLNSAETQAHDAWLDRVDAMESQLAQACPISFNPTQSVLQRVAADVVDGKITFQEGVARLSNKKIIIKK